MSTQPQNGEYYASRLQSGTYETIVLSPHLDDAVYSLAGTMLAEVAAGRRVLVVTVFGHGAAEAPSGAGMFDNYASREREDREAMLALGVDYVWLNEPEVMFRGSRGRARVAEIVPHGSFAGTAVLAEVESAIHAIIERFSRPDGATTLHVPLAIGAHPDHRLVHEAALPLMASRRVSFYEDVPYALEPALLDARLAVLGGERGPNIFAVALGHTRLAFRGLARAVALLPLLVYVGIAEAARRLRSHSAERRPTVAVEQDIAAFAGRKTAAMWLYRSQTPLFFADESALAASLPRRDGHLVERSWRLCS